IRLCGSFEVLFPTELPHDLFRFAHPSVISVRTSMGNSPLYLLRIRGSITCRVQDHRKESVYLFDLEWVDQLNETYLFGQPIR
ncbi:MAG TPA: hypothetical protein VJ044_16935, partial [Candidatus Hodarchaeales archaeon]|nr:hypothetical protein [Candidatus Hodarchaeales archaeon]